MREAVQLQTVLPNLELIARGKVREIYGVDGQLLIVASDRISAFDFILDSGIPQKGKVLNQMSLFWFQIFRSLVPNHVITSKVDEYPDSLKEYARLLSGRSMLVQKAQPFPVECVVRGYLAGSGWKEYQQKRSVCGIDLPEGLLESSKLPHPIFTPATKACSGHDENISLAKMSEIVGMETAHRLREYTLKIYDAASSYAAQRGILIADTKLEFGLLNGEIILIDEVLTPDSSRFWPAESYCPGGPQKSFDKQFVRDYLEESRWNKLPPAPPLPDWVVEATRKKYLEAFEQLTGLSLQE